MKEYLDLVNSYGAQYRSIINRKGLRNCPFCGKAVGIRLELGWEESSVVGLILEHRDILFGECVLHNIRTVVEEERYVVEFLDKWNRREG